MARSYQSARQRLFRLVGIIFIVLIAVYLYIIVSSNVTKAQISKNRAILQERNKELAQLQEMTGFARLDMVQTVRASLTSMPRSTHISKLIEMMQSLQSIESSDGQSVVLSDFRVTLDELSVRGRVSDLALVYYSNPSRGFKSLLEKFADLDFIQNMRIQNYSKGDDGIYEFVLQATINNDNTAK